MDAASNIEEKCRTSGDGMENKEVVEKNGIRSTQSLSDRVYLKSFFKKDKLEQHHIGEDIICYKPSTNCLIRNSINKANILEQSIPRLHKLYCKSDENKQNLLPDLPKVESVELKPKLVKPMNIFLEHNKIKTSRFIPLELYPGTVNAIVQKEDIYACDKRKKQINKNNLDINILVSQMSNLRSQEMEDVEKKTPKIIKQTDQSNESILGYNTDLQLLKEDLRKTIQERDDYKNQLTFQIQINTELKNLLVASVGEDLQAKVHVLTEDKLQLARALLNTANDLTTHTEQTEYLSGQCEVWRSKFLASSVMVEELALWKSDLTQKNQILMESTRKLLHVIHQLRYMQLEILRNLKFVAKIQHIDVPVVNVLTLCNENLNISQQMVLQAGIGVPDTNLFLPPKDSNPNCDAERFAMQALDFISQPVIATDEALKVLFNQAQKSYASPRNIVLTVSDSSLT